MQSVTSLSRKPRNSALATLLFKDRRLFHGNNAAATRFYNKKYSSRMCPLLLFRLHLNVMVGCWFTSFFLFRWEVGGGRLFHGNNAADFRDNTRFCNKKYSSRFVLFYLFVSTWTNVWVFIQFFFWFGVWGGGGLICLAIDCPLNPFAQGGTILSCTHLT